MNGIRMPNGVSLHLIKLLSCKGLCFTFLDGSVMTPVAYVSEKCHENAVRLWNKFLEDLPEQRVALPKQLREEE